jgi:hypothetical protein
MPEWGILSMKAKESKAVCVGGVLAQLAILKARLLLNRLDATPESETHAAIIRQAEEAERLAWLTQYPLLTFPCLFEERAAATCDQARTQANLYWRNLEMAAPNDALAQSCETERNSPARITAGPECLDPGRYLMLMRQHYAKPPWGRIGYCSAFVSQ